MDFIETTEAQGFFKYFSQVYWVDFYHSTKKAINHLLNVIQVIK